MSNWIRNQKMRTKLLGGFGLLALIALLLAGQGMRGTSKVHGEAANIASHARGTMALKESNIALLRVSRAVRNAILDTATADVEKRMSDIKKYEGDFYASMARFDSTIVVEASRAALRNVVEDFRDLRPRQDSVVQLAFEQRDREAQRRLGDIRERANHIEAQMDSLEAVKNQLMASAITSADATYASTIAWSVGLSLVALVLAAVIAVTLTGMITRSLAGVQQAVQRAAQGDLTVQAPVDSVDELGQTGDAVNQLLSSLRESLTVVSQNSSAVASASQQLTAAALEISSGAQEQASSLEETAASLEEMTATVKQNADNAQQANQLAVGARDVAERGGQVVAETVRAMGEINASSRKIADIITTIDEIAFQTNLLALNAAVEAARAGAQGRGFAVVAGEVRSLAQRSATAAKEIKSLIQDSVAKVDSGADLVNRSGTTLQEIVGAVKRVTDIVAEIAAASKEQATGIDQVNKAITQMDAVTQGNAGQTEELSGTAESLAQQAQELQSQVARFELGMGAASAAPRRQAPAAKAPARRPVTSRRPAAARPSSNGNGNGKAHGYASGNGNGTGHAPMGGRLATLEPNGELPPTLPDLDEGFEEY